MLRGIYPGSITTPPSVHSKLLRKRDQLLTLYKNHFNRHLSTNAVLDQAERDPVLASQIYVSNPAGLPMVASSLIMNSNYFKKSLKAFIEKAKTAGLITDVLGQGVHGLTLLIKEDGFEIVVKLPVNSETNFEGNGYCALQNEYDHTQKISRIPHIDHDLVVQPVDELSIRGKILAFGKLGGVDLFDRDHFNDATVSAFAEYRDRESFAPAKMAELIKIYMKIYQSGLSTLSYGSPHNTRLVQEGTALALYDLCSQPPLPEHDLKQLELQQKLFGGNALACALFQVLTNGNINFLVDGDIANKFRFVMAKGNHRLDKFHAYRETLLKDSLQVLLDRDIVSRDELIVNLESLRDVNSRIDNGIFEYLRFKGHGPLIQLGQNLAQRLIEHFKA